MKARSSVIKRLVDVVLAAAGLFLTTPMVVSLALVLRRSTGAGGLAQQQRAGLDGRPFILLKLRTMTEARDATGALLPEAERLTGLGRIVRTLSIDELPQLLNVLRGEMSIVGPRPLPIIYERLYTDRERLRLAVRPGLTGWAQISGRHRISVGERLELDAWYVENWSTALDLRIMLLTVARLLRRQDVMVDQDIAVVDDRGFHALFREYQASEDEETFPRTSRMRDDRDYRRVAN